nr:uncharacterized protein LOC127316095 [Lolium perenne]
MGVARTIIAAWSGVSGGAAEVPAPTWSRSVGGLAVRVDFVVAAASAAAPLPVSPVPMTSTSTLPAAWPLGSADLGGSGATSTAEAARIPQLESDLRVARAQCATSEEANRAAAAKLKVADGELKRLRLLEANHLKELAALKKEQEEKLEGLSKRLEEVERQRLSLQQEVTTKSNELSATAKRWLGELSALDRGLAAAFPEAQEEALAAVGRAREDRRQATGEQSSDCFTMDDYLASIAARVEPVTKLGWELRKVAEELWKLPNVISMFPCISEKVEREELLCGVNS